MAVRYWKPDVNNNPDRALGPSRVRRSKVWQVWQVDDDGEQHLAWVPVEPMARRIAVRYWMGRRKPCCIEIRRLGVCVIACSDYGPGLGVLIPAVPFGDARDIAWGPGEYDADPLDC